MRFLSIRSSWLYNLRQAGHGPPQSIPVSPWFIIPSSQVGGARDKTKCVKWNQCNLENIFK